MADQSHLPSSASDEAPPNPTEPYQPFLDMKPPVDAPISSANGTLVSGSEKEKELESDSMRADREATPEPDDFHIEFPAGLPTPPFVHVQGVPNFRDLGGYRCSPPSSASSSDEGKTIYTLRRGVLFRCAHPTHLTPKGLSTLTTTLGISKMYDLRSGPEISRLAATVANSPADLYPLADPNTGTIESHGAPGLERVFVPVYQNEDYGPVALARKLQWYTDTHKHDEERGFEYSEGFVKAYRDIATHGAAAYTAIFRQLLANAANEQKHGQGLIFHCTAGKDRTGVLGALIHKLVGVDEDTICWEYALTEPGLGKWRDQFMQRISASGLGGGGGKPASPEKIYTGDRQAVSREEAARICGSRAGNMRAWLDQVLQREFGGVERYLTEKCGLTADEVVTLRDYLVVSVGADDDVVKVSSIEGWTPDGGVVD
ncbi:uncharacterized protein A1O9_02692 [Exophiala aquamarina CBS 119918]|uniref:Tyrosine specific protein phosphatases domain-containing protein n=1 Tax=Exophiala aquamarina CBS 119918 TaxID=1182545 RepID=A0A072PMZ3_9EURO|nr:uncharacterized protein A1O9_02692 [Exophiala aquamarina CBS 119918]KEF61127.1 hypothetical protein A1O9_02692 [Exophiala aquamarina CBS 119918]